jgi:hypothetical protein
MPEELARKAGVPVIFTYKRARVLQKGPERGL